MPHIPSFAFVKTSDEKQIDQKPQHCVYKPDDEDALRQFPGPLPEGVSFVVAIERPMLEDKRQSVSTFTLKQLIIKKHINSD